MTSQPSSTRDTSSAASARRLAELRRRQRVPTSTSTTTSSRNSAGTPTTSSSLVATPSSLATTPGATGHRNRLVVPSSSRDGDTSHQASTYIPPQLQPVPSASDSTTFQDGTSLRHGLTTRTAITATPWSSLTKTRSDNATATTLTEDIPPNPFPASAGRFPTSAARSEVGEPATVGRSNSQQPLALPTRTDAGNEAPSTATSTRCATSADTSHRASSAVAAGAIASTQRRDASPTALPRQYDENDVTTIEDQEQGLRMRSNWKAPVDFATSVLSGTTIQICGITSLPSSLLTTAREHAVAVQHSGTNDLDKAIRDNGDLAQGTVDGRGLALGREEELWEILKVSAASGTNPLAQNDRVVRFGDTIVLRATTHPSTVVGRRQSNRWSLSIARDPKERTWQPCLLPLIDETALEQRWVVIRGKLGPNGLVRIGETALTVTPVEMAFSHRQGRGSPTRAFDTNKSSAGFVGTAGGAFASLVVQSGDAILLRNCRNGGVLSVLTDGTLVVRTDSYDDEMNRTGITGSDAELMGRLQRHDLFTPSQQDLLYLFPSTVPCPLPNSHPNDSMEEIQRIFCNRSYLLHQDRHSVDAVLDDVVFESPSFGDSTFFEYQAQIESSLSEQMNETSYQEQVLFDEVLGSFIGLEGSFVKAFPTLRPGNHPGLVFRLEDDPTGSIEIDASLRNLVKDMLQLSSSYANVRTFVGSHSPGYEYGMVMQALCETLDAMLQEYVTFIGDLEHRYRQRIGSTSLRQLQVDINPVAGRMLVLHQVIEAARYKTGGALLNSLDLLQQRLVGDPVASQVLKVLLNAAAAPYLRMFRRWIERGDLDDPYDEFMLRLNDRAWTWDKRYVIVEKHVLFKFFASDTALANATATGRYWNAVRACQPVKNVSMGEHAMHGKLQFDSAASDVLATVHVLHRTASRHLVNILFGDFDLVRSLRVTRKYFLLDQGDFFVNFMDAAEAELLKEHSSITLGRIQHWLLGAVQLSEHDTEPQLTSDKEQKSRLVLSPFKIICRFLRDDLLDHLDKLYLSPGSKADSRSSAAIANEGVRTGLDSFVIDFESIPFPLSLVLTPLAMRSYQLLFRHLFYAKYVERRLVGIWHDHQTLRELQSMRGVLGATFLLRQRMLHLVQNLIYYMMLEVVEPNWMSFENAISSEESQKEQTVDEVCGAHAEFLRKTLEACLLTSPDILRSLTKLLGTCLLFTNEMKLFMTATNLESDRCTVAKEKRIRMRRCRHDRMGLHKSSNSRSAIAKILVDDIAERKERVKRQAGIVRGEASSDSYCQMVARFDEIFSEHLCDFMLQLKYSGGFYQKHVINLCTRLDYNGFVSRALGLSAESKRQGSSSANG